MNAIQFFVFIVGIVTFGIGISIGWTMRGSVKEDNLHQLSHIFELMQKLNNKIDDRRR